MEHSAWKTSKESSPLANGLMERTPTKRSSQLDTKETKERSERKKDREREKSRPLDPEDMDILRRVEQLLDDRSRREFCRVEELVSSAVGRVGEAFRTQVEALRRDLARQQPQDGLLPADSALACGSTLSSSRSGRGPTYGFAHSDTSPRELPEAHTGLLILRTAFDEQRKSVDMQLSGLLARVNALQQCLTESALQQELHHIATGKFACTVLGFTTEEKEASLRALQGQEDVVKERLCRLRRLPKSPLKRSTVSSNDDVGWETSSSASGISAPATGPLSPQSYLQSMRRRSIAEEDDQPLVDLLPSSKGTASSETRGASHLACSAAA